MPLHHVKTHIERLFENAFNLNISKQLTSCFVPTYSHYLVYLHAYKLAWKLTFAMAVVMGIVSLWTPFLDPKFMARWFSVPSIYFVSIVPVLTVGLFVGLVYSLTAKRDNLPFILTLGLFLASYSGLGNSIYPYMVPPSITIWQAAAPDESLLFLLVGAVVLLPIIIGYTAYSYRIFRGKTRSGEGYH